MDALISILRTVAPALATAALGPAGGLVVSAIAKKLGVADEVNAVTSALTANPELALKLREIDVREFEAEQVAITGRWQADLASDSWLAKNIRPMTLVYLLTAYLGLAVSDGFGFKVAEAYVTLLGQWGMLVMGAYFGGRSIEKITATVRGRQ